MGSFDGLRSMHGLFDRAINCNTKVIGGILLFVEFPLPYCFMFYKNNAILGLIIESSVLINQCVGLCLFLIADNLHTVVWVNTCFRLKLSIMTL